MFRAPLQATVRSVQVHPKAVAAMMDLEVRSIICPATQAAPLLIVPLVLGLFSEGNDRSAKFDGGTNLNE